MSDLLVRRVRPYGDDPVDVLISDGVITAIGADLDAAAGVQVLDLSQNSPDFHRICPRNPPVNAPYQTAGLNPSSLRENRKAGLPSMRT